MSRRKLDRKAHRGDPVSASTLNEFRREIRRNRLVLPPGTETLQTAAGLMVRPTAAEAGMLLGRTSGVIPARSGLMADHGTVRIFAVRSDWSLVDTDQDLVCGNATGGTIAANKFCGVATIDGLPFIVWAEC